MAKSNLSIELVDTDRVIVAKINKALAKEINSKMLKKVSLIKSMLKPVIATALFSSPEIISLGSGVLRFDFGIPDDPAAAIADMIANSLQFNYSKVRLRGKNLAGGLTITLQPTDYTLLRTSSVGMTETEDGDVLPWLDWLLTLGDSIIIVNFGVQYGPYGRTGGARMVPTSKNPSIRPFQVNPNYSGNEADNFITRAIAAQAGPIRTLIMNTLRG